MNRNLMGSTYGRFCIKFPQSRMKGERHRLSPLSLQFLYTVTSFLSLFPYSCNVYTSVFLVSVCLWLLIFFRKEHQDKKWSQKRRLPNGCPQNVFTAKQSELYNEDVQDLLKSHARRYKKSADIKILLAPPNKPA